MTRKSTSRVFESLAAASAVLDVPVPILRAAKAKGAPHFKIGNRIREVENGVTLKAWIADHADDLKAAGENLSLKDQKTNEEIRKLKLANDLKEGALVSRLAVQSSVSKTAEAIKSFLTQKLENEYPSAVAGLDVAGARVYGKRVNDEILRELQKLGEFWEI